MLNLHAVYRQAGEGYWEATIAMRPWIHVEFAPCLDSARELLSLYVAEELGKVRWAISQETIL